MNIDGVQVLQPDVFTDFRGDLWTLWKELVTCLQGELYFVVVDPRKNSKTYSKWDNLILDDKSRKQVLLPPGVGNGFLVMSDTSVFHYKWSYPGEYPDVNDQFTIKWDDPKWNIYWPIKTPILQSRDR